MPLGYSCQSHPTSKSFGIQNIDFRPVKIGVCCLSCIATSTIKIDRIKSNISESRESSKRIGDWRLLCLSELLEKRITQLTWKVHPPLLPHACIDKALNITSTHPDYDGYTNNCQNFVRRLLNYVCPGASGPQTIQEFISDLTSTNAAYPISSIPGTYPASSISVSSS
jgi:hypothetical protein